MANTRKLTGALPDEARELMVGLGADLRLARRRRRMSVVDLAQRVMVSPPTIRKLERGDPTVSLGVVAVALWILGFGDGIKGLAAPEKDAFGLRAEMERLARSGRKVRDELDF